MARISVHLSAARGIEEMRGDGPASILDVLAPILAVSYPGDGARLLTGSEAGSSPALPASRSARSHDQAELSFARVPYLPPSAGQVGVKQANVSERHSNARDSVTHYRITAHWQRKKD